MSTTLGALVVSRDPRNPAYVTFSLFAAGVSIWSIFYIFWQTATNKDSALLFTRLFMLAAVFIPFFYFHFVVLFTEAKYFHKVLAWIGYIFAAFFAALSFSPLFIRSVDQRLSFAFWPDPGVLFLPFLAIWLFYVAYAFTLLLRAYKRSHSHRKQQIRFIIVGMFVGYLGGITNYLLWYHIPVQPFGNILVSVYVLMVGYAVIRHRLFDVKVIVTDFTVISLWVLSLVRLLLSSDTREYIINGIYLIGLVVIGVFLILSIRKEINSREEVEKLALKLERANKRLKELDKMKSEFVSIASHQLRSPLTSLRGYASMLLDGSYGRIPKKAQGAIERIADSSALMARSVENYLNVSRIESGNMKYELADFNLKEEASKLVDDKRQEAIKKGLVLTFKSDLIGTGIVNADIGKTIEILHNLVNNSVKYTPNGSVTVFVHDDRKAKEIYVDIIDTGIGMEQKDIENLFGKFARASNANSVNTGGTGLGLFVARTMAQAMKGDITVQSDGPGKGSTFTLTLPEVK